MMLGRNVGAIAAANRIPPDSVGVEIGVWRGDSTELFLQRAAHVHLVDPWSVAAYSNSDEFGGYAAYLERYEKIVGSRRVEDFQRHYDAVYASVVTRFENRPVTIHRSTSAAFFEAFTESVDWIYIDGSHSFEGCLFDLTKSLEIVRPGGVILGDDYGNKPGVTAAVNEFARRHTFEVETFCMNQYQIKL